MDILFTVSVILGAAIAITMICLQERDRRSIERHRDHLLCACRNAMRYIRCDAPKTLVKDVILSLLEDAIDDVGME